MPSPIKSEPEKPKAPTLIKENGGRPPTEKLDHIEKSPLGNFQTLIIIIGVIAFIVCCLFLVCLYKAFNDSS